jgi:hypothetical protein
MPRHRVEFLVKMNLVRWADGETAAEAWSEIVRVQKERLLYENGPTIDISFDAFYVRPICLPCNGLGYLDDRKPCEACNGRGMKV